MRNPRRNVMDSVKMNKLKLLEIVKDNLRKHVSEFEESVVDYRKLVLKICQENLEIAESGDTKKFKDMKHLPASPISYENSYKRAIRMLELSIEDTIEVEEDVFNQLVLDEWDWKHSFSASNAMYKSF